MTNEVITATPVYAARPTALQIMFDERLFAQASRVANMMAGARGIIGNHLVGKPEACFAIVVNALTTGLNPYSIAAATYQTPAGRVGYEGALVHAMLEASGEFDGAIKYEHLGDWSKVRGKFTNEKSKKPDAEGNDRYYPKRSWTHADAAGLSVKVIGKLKSEAVARSYELPLQACYPLNSTLWATQPDQQICYRAIRGFGKLCVPHIMMGIPGDDDVPVGYAGDTIEMERPQVATEQQTGEPPVDSNWLVVTAEGETLEFRTRNGAISALHKILEAASRQSYQAHVAAWDNNPFCSGDDLSPEEWAELQELKPPKEKPADEPPAAGGEDAVSQTSDASTTSAASSPPVTPEPPTDLKPADEKWWYGESLVVQPPKKGGAPEWKLWPLTIGQRLRQAWTMHLVDTLAKDNAENMRLFAQARGTESADELKKQFEDRRTALRAAVAAKLLGKEEVGDIA